MRVHRRMSVSRACRDGRIQKFLKKFQKIGAKIPPWVAITPIEGYFVGESGENDFFEKVGKSLIVPEKEMRLGKETSRKMKEEWMQLDTQ